MLIHEVPSKETVKSDVNSIILFKRPNSTEKNDPLALRRILNRNLNRKPKSINDTVSYGYHSLLVLSTRIL